MNNKGNIGINGATYLPVYKDETFIMQCRLGCGACCIAPSITSAIPGMPTGKAAGERCIQLNDENLCKLFGLPERPKVCTDFGAESWVCGDTNEQALIILTDLESNTVNHV